MESAVASAPAAGHRSLSRRIACYTCAVLLLAAGVLFIALAEWEARRAAEAA
jgi:hypothetical protein